MKLFLVCLLISFSAIATQGPFRINGGLQLKGSTSGYVGLAPAAVAGSATYTFPAADGTAGQMLSTDGSGGLSWAYSGTTGADNSGTGALTAVSTANMSYLRFTGALPLVHGLANGADKRTLTITFTGATALTLANESTTEGTAANRITTDGGEPIIIQAGGSVSLVYDSSNSRWRAIGKNQTDWTHKNVYRTTIDAYGVYTIIQWKRGTYLEKDSTLSGGTAPAYTTRTIRLYAGDGTTVLKTLTYTLTYTNGELTSEAL